jgi:hypothetical protein
MWKSDHAFQEPFKLCGSKEGRGFLLFFELKTIRPSNRSYNFRITIQAKPDLVPSLLINVYPTRKWFIDILVWSQFYSTHKLYERAMQFCASHFRELCVLQEWTELETVDIDFSSSQPRSGESSARIQRHCGSTESGTSRRTYQFITNSSIEEADVSSTSTGTMLLVSDNSLEEERTLFEDQVTQEAENLVVARYISAPSSSIADNSQSGQLSQKYVDKV